MGLGNLSPTWPLRQRPTLASPERRRIVPARTMNVATPAGFASVAGPKLQRGFGEPHPGVGSADEVGFARRGSDFESDILVTLEEAVTGSERSISLQRVDRSTGQARTQTLKVRIPPGVHEGQAIRVAGMGEDGIGGGAPGDLFLRVRFAAHPEYIVRGSDLYYALDLAPWEAVLGTRVIVPTLKDQVSVSIPAGTNQGRQLRIRGRGLPIGRTDRQGDLYVVINIELPQHVSAEERGLWEKLSQISNFNPRKT